MGPMMIGQAHGAANLVSLPPDRPVRILDVAAGHGMFGIIFAQKNPSAHLVSLDWANVLTVARENARAAGIGDRFSTIAGDAFSVELGAEYDVVLVPNFLHHFSATDCTRFLRRVRDALRPGGRVAIIEFVPNADRITPPMPASFSLIMLANTPEGDAYTFSEYSDMLAAAGFKTPSIQALSPTPQSLIVAEK
jgi:ubiquinone/menaquinone biosynthesis C-methylase UbiE